MSLRPSFARVLDGAEQARKNPGQVRGLLTGIGPLDRKLRGLRGCTLVGARPSMGKTTMLQTVIKNICETSLRDGIPRTVGFLSAEMGQDDLARRWLCMTSGVRAEDLDLGRLTAQEMSNLRQAAETMAHWPLLIDDHRSPTLDYVRHTFTRWNQEAGDSLSLIVVDHLGEIVSPGAQSDYRAATDVASLLADAAEEMGIPIL